MNYEWDWKREQGRRTTSFKPLMEEMAVRNGDGSLAAIAVKHLDWERERGSGQMPGEGGHEESTPQTRLWAGFCAVTHPSQDGCPGPSPSAFPQARPLSGLK